MDRRNFLISVCAALAGTAGCLISAGCVAPLISPKVSQQKSQAWRCGNWGHLTRSAQNLTVARCPRCKRKGFLAKINEKGLQDYLKLYTAS
jgi:hypothetical protein